jgi:hypothetical protein
MLAWMLALGYGLMSPLREGFTSIKAEFGRKCEVCIC